MLKGGFSDETGSYAPGDLQVMEGDIGPIIRALQKADYEEKLAALTGRPVTSTRGRGAEDNE